MATHLSDEEQLESLKRWWRENGWQTVAAVVLVIGGWYGWQFWQEEKHAQAQDASLIYGQMIDVLAESEGEPGPETMEQLVHLAETLKALDGDSQYARYAAMTLARLAVLEGDLGAAAAELRWALEQAEGEPLAHILRLRLARVLSAQDDYEQALALLDGAAPGAFEPLYAESKGDIHASRGDAAAARAAYQQALESLEPGDANARSLLELKLSRVAAVDGNPEEDA